MIQITVVMLLARRYPRHWWIPATSIFVGLIALAIFVSPYLLALGVNPPKSPQLRQDVRTLEQREGVSGTPVDVEEVSDLTTQANAFATGLGPTDAGRDLGHAARQQVRPRRDPRRPCPRVRARRAPPLVEGHRVGGPVRFPLAFALAEITRRRGGLATPASCPSAFLVLLLLQVALTPAQNVVSRHVEAEADWVALQTTRDPASGRGLFEKFQETSLAQPNPPHLGLPLPRDTPDDHAADRDGRGLEGPREP